MSKIERQEKGPKETCGVFIVFERQLLICHATGGSWQRWTLPKGMRDPGEERLQAALREVHEEAGIDLAALKAPLTYVGEAEYTDKRKTLFAWSTVLTETPPPPLVCTTYLEDSGLPEIDGYAWVGYDEAERKLQVAAKALLPALRELLDPETHKPTNLRNVTPERKGPEPLSLLAAATDTFSISGRKTQ